MKKEKISTLISVLLFFASITSIQAQSVYSSRGLGLIGYFLNGRASGMGGVGLAMTSDLTVSFMNPAGLSALPITTISGNIRHTSANLRNSGQNASISDTNVLGAQFVIPLKRERVAISLGLNPYSSIEYTFESDAGLSGDKPFVQTVEGNGGVNTAFFSFSIRPIRRLYLGASGLFYFGVLKNRWTVDFADISLTDTQSEVNQSITGFNFRFGFILEVLSNLRVSGVYTPSVNLDSDVSLNINTVNLPNFSQKDIKVPRAFGVGTSWALGKLLLGVDYYRQEWSDFAQDGFVNDSERIAFGFEYSGRGAFRSSYFSRMAVRAGIYYSNLGIEEPIDNEVTEIFGSVGVGLPIKWSAGRIDLALEVGRRGSMSKNPFRENIIRFTGSITVGERWFFRAKR